MKKHNINFLNYFSFLIKVLLIYSVNSTLLADENQIGFVSGINGNVVAINNDLEERDLNELDPIFLNEEIFVTENSTVTLQFNDNSTIIMKELTSFVVNEFKNLKNNKQFISEVLNGELIVETGSIAKNKIGNMEVSTKTSSLGLRGTRMNIDLKDEKDLSVSLGEDNFGNIGQIEIISNGQQQTIFSTDEVIEISNDKINKRQKTIREINQEELSNKIIINNSIIDEDKIEIQLVSKLASGKISDMNNDGKVDIDDVEVLKNQILDKKKQKVDFIIDNSKKENTNFISGVIDGSDDKNIGQALEKIIKTNDTLVEDVIEDLSDKNNEFLITSNIKDASLIKEKIFETIVLKETENSAEILSKVMDKSDEATISSLINNITDKNDDEKSKLSLKVMSDFSEKNPEKLNSLAKNKKNVIQKLTASAISKASITKEDADLIANIVTKAGKEITNNVVSEVNKNSTDEKESLSAKVLGSIIEKDSQKLETLNEQNKETIITKTIKAAVEQSKENLKEDTDLSSIVGKIIIKTNNQTAIQILENFNEQTKDVDTNLTLKVFINISKEKNFEDKLESISEQSDIADNLVEKTIERALEDIENNKELREVKDIILESGDYLTTKIIEIDQKTKKENKLKIQKIIVDIIKEDPIKAKEILEIVDNIENEENKLKRVKEIKDVIDQNITPN